MLCTLAPIIPKIMQILDKQPHVFILNPFITEHIMKRYCFIAQKFCLSHLFSLLHLFFHKQNQSVKNNW